ncbi:hypothetical protein [Desulfogranum japonicum]|uniref:hypothetical protein n=1 Tax=Desulfogranum japonicum TaxID=231447 RepID=UPI0003FD59E0|nr:hypothetical protein [Desulfogranum japonicum]
MIKTALPGVCAAALFYAVLSPASAGTLTIGSGSTFDINGGSLLMNCQNITIQNGGTLLLQDGSLIQRNFVTVESGGTYTKTGGTETQCSGNRFYFLFNKEGRPVIFCLPKG